MNQGLQLIQFCAPEAHLKINNNKTKTHLFTWWLYQPANYFPYLEFFAPCVRLLIDNPFQLSIHSTTKSFLTSLRGSDVCRFQVILIKTLVLNSLLSSPSQFLKMARAGKSQIPFLRRTNLPCWLGPLVALWIQRLFTLLTWIATWERNQFTSCLKHCNLWVFVTVHFGFCSN